MAEHQVDVLRLPMSITAFVGATEALAQANPDVELLCRGGSGVIEVFYVTEDD